MSTWRVVFKNGAEIHVKGGNEVLNATDPANGNTILRSLAGRNIGVNNAEVLYVQEVIR